MRGWAWDVLTCAGLDWVNNALGALLGMAVGAVVLRRVGQNGR